MGKVLHMSHIVEFQVPALRQPYLLFVGDVSIPAAAKTANGLLQWRTDACIGQSRLPGGVDLGLPDLSPEEAAAQGAGTLVIGVVNPGGVIDPSWVPLLVEALDAGLDLAAGLHQRLNTVPAIAAAAARNGRALHDVRHADRTFPTGTGVKRTGKRVLTVGTDCVVGKKYTALALHQALVERDVAADFRATGQTGVLIAGGGIAIDAVVADFIAGAAEALSPAADPDHWDVIEGQGSLFHPAYAGVTLGLIHGSQPDALVICHEPVRNNLLSVDFPVQPLASFIEANLAAARLTNPNVVAVGVSINGGRMTDAELAASVGEIEAATGLPCCDPIRHGAGRIAEHMLRAVI